IAPVFSVEAARSFIARIKAEFDDATHNVPIFVIGYGASVTAHSNDDGEPSGTAGRPALAVLQGSGLGDAAVVITRYFGGSKLGTGGLVRAYGDAVRAVLKITPRAEKVPTHTVIINMPYSYFENVRRLAKSHHGLIKAEDFKTNVTITCQFAVAQFPEFQSALQELSHGSLQAEIIATNQDTIISMGTFSS
ncbi:MAG: YigZ family protein, partial [Chloroflexota bacterium]|nr:YigZ family protein [Chloroflexota bacterium]